MVLYFQMLFTMLIGFYTSRIILNVLGISDYGLYNVIGGVVAIFGILYNSMTTSTSRHITFEIGRGEESDLKNIFNTSIIIHFLLAITVCLVSIPVGKWFITNKLEIPNDRYDAAYWVYYCTLITMFLTIISVPYNALIVANERMKVFAYISIIESLLKLLILYIIGTYSNDKLKLYASLLVLVQFIIQTIQYLYCRKNFIIIQEKISFKIKKKVFKEMFSFAGWNMFGDSAFILYTQGINLLLNIFFGTTINAARGIAVQVQTLIMRFITGFQTALNPQITKSYAKNDLSYMHKLIFSSSKYSFCLFLIIATFIYLNLEFLLILWLKQIPSHTVNFINIMLFSSLIDCLSNPLIISAKASGKVRKYQIVIGSLLLVIVPLSYVFLSIGYPPEIVFIIHLIITIIAQFVRVILIKPIIALPIKSYINEVIIKCILIMISSAIFIDLIYRLNINQILCSLIILTLQIITIYYLVLRKDEQLFLNNVINKKIFGIIKHGK